MGRELQYTLCPTHTVSDWGEYGYNNSTSGNWIRDYGLDSSGDYTVRAAGNKNIGNNGWVMMTGFVYGSSPPPPPHS